MTEPLRENDRLIKLTAEIVAGYVRNNTVSIKDMASLIENVHGALMKLPIPIKTIPRILKPAPPIKPVQPAVPISESMNRDWLICLEDGKTTKRLRPYLMRWFQMTPDEYRAKWGLPDDYPMIVESKRAARKQTRDGAGPVDRPKQAKEAAVPKSFSPTAKTKKARGSASGI